MNEEGFKRKLTTMFTADVAGYSRLMEQDEAQTVKTLTAYRQIMIDLIKQHRGRVVDSPGDNLLAEFPSVVDAVQCAMAVQKELQARNASLPGDRRMEFRIGINLGDVIEEGERIYGDGVNIAARLEALAEPGGICVSKTAFDQIETKLPLGYEYLGEQNVKNISKPVGAYKVLMEPRILVAGEKEEMASVPLWQRKGVLAGAAVTFVVIICLLVWNFYWRVPRIEPASKKKMAFSLPDMPSIAVLPFDNLSGDPKQEYFSDGLTEEIINALSKNPYIFVISRKSTFAYKGKPVKVQQISEELGVHYILEGSVRKSGDRIRITTQLIDAISGLHLWSERYDRDLKSIFALQDEITMKVVSKVGVKLRYAEEVSISEKGPKNLEAYLKYLEGAKVYRTFKKEDIAAARPLFEKAIALDSEYGRAYCLAAFTHILDVTLNYTKFPKQSLARAKELIDKALLLNPSSAYFHAIRSIYLRVIGKHEEAVAAARKAVDLSYTSSLGNSMLGAALVAAGRYEESIQFLKKGARLDPLNVNRWHQLARGYNSLGQCEEAIQAAERGKAITPNNLIIHIRLTNAYILCGREEDARTSAAEVRRINPKFSFERISKRIKFKNPADKERYIERLRKAGLK